MISEEIIIGVITYKRPLLLENLLSSLRAHVVHEVVESIIVVDNDPCGSARTVVDAAQTQGMRISYTLEEQPGVSYARNRVFAESGDCTALIFLDDDEEVTAGWFEAFLRAYRDHPACVITGPIKYLLPPEAPSWLKQGDFFDRPVYERGAKLSSTGTGNTLIPLNVVNDLGAPPFDPAFSLSGGEDYEFFRRLRARGVLIVWEPDALITETVPVERANWRWLMKRYERIGNVHARVALRSRSRVTVMSLGIMRISFGFARWQLRRMTRRSLRVRDVATHFAGRGYVLAAMGVEVREQGHRGYRIGLARRRGNER